MERIEAPWTDDQVKALNRFQRQDHVHPFTCPHNHGNQTDRILLATPAGWVCRYMGCGYTQNWAHAMMTWDWDVKRRQS